jgi:hypothetical protein
MDLCQQILTLISSENPNDLTNIKSKLATLDSTWHDHLAYISLKCGDYRLFELLDRHHPRILMDNLARHPWFQRLIQWYHMTGYLPRREIPTYVWLKVDQSNAQFLKLYNLSPDELDQMPFETRLIFEGDS